VVRPRATVLVKLLGAFAVPTLALFALFAVIALEVTRRDLDAELGHRLEAVAAATSTQIRGKYLAELPSATPRIARTRTSRPSSRRWRRSPARTCT
jgi:hypothetical protein